MHAVTWLTVTSAFVLGVVLALLGSMKLTLARRLNLDEVRVGGLVSAFSFALIPMMLCSGLLIDRWGVRLVLVVGCLAAAAAVYGLAVRPGYAWATWMTMLLGLGAACLSTAAVVLMPVAFFDDDRQVPAALNLGHVFIALGALVTPVLTEALLRLLDFRRTLGLVALLCLAPAPFILWADRLPPLGESRLDQVLSSPQLWLAGLIFSLYAPVEFCLGTWGTTYLTDLGYREGRAAWLLSGFWLTFLAGRVLAAALAIRGTFGAGSGPWLILLLALAVAVFLGNMAGSAQPRRAALALLVLGFLLGPIFPTLVGIVFTDFPAQRGTAYGAMFAIGSLGSFVLGPVIGTQARRRTVQEALRIPLVLALGLMGACLVLALTH